MAEKRDVRKQPLTQKWVTIIIAVILVLFVAFSLSVLFGAFSDIENDFQRISLCLILLWIGILLTYYIWAIFYYNINLGFSDVEWKEIWERIDKTRKDFDAGLEVNAKDLEAPEDNPYKDETFGLPPGTVRGTIALTLLMGGLSMLIYSFGAPLVDLGDNFKFFIDAFLMMVAFYFGSRALAYLQSKKENGQAATSKAEEPKATVAQTVVTKAVQKIKKVEPAKAENGETEKEKKLVKDFPQVKQEEENLKLDDEIIEETANKLGIEPAALKAVTKVESSGSGFLANGKPKILFEGHIFWRELKKLDIDPMQFALANPDILYKKWTKEHYKGGKAEFERLEKAKLINNEAALSSASWGLFQIMGFNYKVAGYKNVVDFVEAQHKSEGEHLNAFCNYIKSRKLIPHLQNLEWAEFARKYNGPGYKKNKYDTRLQRAYENFKEQFEASLA